MIILPERDQEFICNNGWLMLDGTFYGCNWAEHKFLANGIFPDAKDAEIECEKFGILKISTSLSGNLRVYQCNSSLTSEQLNTLHRFCQKYHFPFEHIIEALSTCGCYPPDSFNRKRIN